MLYLWIVAACGSFECDRLFIPDLLVVRLEAESWPSGEHVVTLTDADTFDEVRCTATLPDEIFSCSDGASQVQFADGGLARVDVWAFSPDTVTVAVEQDGAVVFLEDVQPDYEEAEPNGEGCGIQRLAGIDVVL